MPPSGQPRGAQPAWSLALRNKYSPGKKTKFLYTEMSDQLQDMVYGIKTPPHDRIEGRNRRRPAHSDNDRPGASDVRGGQMDFVHDSVWLRQPKILLGSFFGGKKKNS